MKVHFQGILTVFLSLVMVLFLSFCLVLTEGSRNCFLRAKAEQAMELAEFSALSEYEPALLERYGLFFLDLDYGQGKEQTQVLHHRIQTYLSENASELSGRSLNVRNFHRATDGGGSVFFRQAVEAEKFRNGIGFLEELLPEPAAEIDLGQEAANQEAEADGILSGLTDENGEPLFQVSVPHISFPDAGALRKAVLGEETEISAKEISLSERISGRRLMEGSGKRDGKSFAQMQIFHHYVLEHCGYYGQEKASDVENAPEYGVEYVIAGEKSDRENLENVMWRIFLLRAAGNYLFSHQNAKKTSEAEGKAMAAVGVTGNAALVQAVRELFLLEQAIRTGFARRGSCFAEAGYRVLTESFCPAWKWIIGIICGCFCRRQEKRRKFTVPWISSS